MSTTLSVNNHEVEITKKDIKNIHLSVHPPNGKIKVSAPLKIEDSSIKAFVLTKLEWIKNHQNRLKNQERETKRELVNRESIFVWGNRYLIQLENTMEEEDVSLNGNKLIMFVKPNETFERRNKLLERWFRKQIRDKAKPFIKRWETKLSVELNTLHVQRMKTKWGSCNPSSKSIRLNTELIHKKPKALEYIILHELLHFIEPKHSDNFFRLLDSNLPQWRFIRKQLNAEKLSYSITKET